MNVQWIQKYCLSLPHVTEDIKWGNDLCFSIGKKMFCVVGLQEPNTASFKVTEDEFEEMAARDGFKPAPYMAKYQWVFATDLGLMNRKEWEHYISQSYALVRAKLAPKILKTLD